MRRDLWFVMGVYASVVRFGILTVGLRCPSEIPCSVRRFVPESQIVPSLRRRDLRVNEHPATPFETSTTILFTLHSP
jgi:hypothetical protein